MYTSIDIATIAIALLWPKHGFHVPTSVRWLDPKDVFPTILQLFSCKYYVYRKETKISIISRSLHFASSFTFCSCWLMIWVGDNSKACICSMRSFMSSKILDPNCMMKSTIVLPWHGFPYWFVCSICSYMSWHNEPSR